MKQILLSICCALICQVSIAETCPSIHDIKNSTLKSWTAYDSADEQPLTSARLAEFKKSATAFSLAEWFNDSNKHGAIHCYYHDKEGSDMEAYLSKENYAPKSSAAKHWYEVSGAKQCAAGAEACEFEVNVASQGQLANN